MEEAIELYLEELVDTGAEIPTPGMLKDQINTIGDLQSGAFISFISNHADFHAKSA